MKILLKCTYCPEIVERAQGKTKATCFPCKALQQKMWQQAHSKQKKPKKVEPRKVKKRVEPRLLSFCSSCSKPYKRKALYCSRECWVKEYLVVYKPTIKK